MILEVCDFPDSIRLITVFKSSNSWAYEAVERGLKDVSCHEYKLYVCACMYLHRETNKLTKTLKNSMNKVLRWIIQVYKSAPHCNNFKSSLLLSIAIVIWIFHAQRPFLYTSVDTYLAKELVKGQSISPWKRNINVFIRAADKHRVGHLKDVREYVTLFDYYSWGRRRERSTHINLNNSVTVWWPRNNEDYIVQE